MQNGINPGRNGLFTEPRGYSYGTYGKRHANKSSLLAAFKGVNNRGCGPHGFYLAFLAFFNSFLSALTLLSCLEIFALRALISFLTVFAFAISLFLYRD